MAQVDTYKSRSESNRHLAGKGSRLKLKPPLPGVASPLGTNSSFIPIPNPIPSELVFFKLNCNQNTKSWRVIKFFWKNFTPLIEITSEVVGVKS